MNSANASITLLIGEASAGKCRLCQCNACCCGCTPESTVWEACIDCAGCKTCCDCEQTLYA